MDQQPLPKPTIPDRVSRALAAPDPAVAVEALIREVMDEAVGAGAEDTGANPRRHRLLSRPFATAAEAEAATKSFHRAVGALRERFRIANVFLLSSVTDEEKEHPFTMTATLGDYVDVAMLVVQVGTMMQGKLREIIGRLAGPAMEEIKGG
jgi:hypothetical protein